MPAKQSKKSDEGTKVEKDEFLTDGEKSAMMTMRRRPLGQTVPDMSCDNRPPCKQSPSARLCVS